MECRYCYRPAVYVTTSEGDPYALACEDGHSVRLDDERELLALVNGNEDKVEQRIAEAIAAERAAIRAEVERRRREADAASTAPSTQGFVAGFMERQHVDLLKWLDARSKGEAEQPQPAPPGVDRAKLLALVEHGRARLRALGGGGWAGTLMHDTLADFVGRVDALAHDLRCETCGAPATVEQCGGLLACTEHIGPGRAWAIDERTIALHTNKSEASR